QRAWVGVLPTFRIAARKAAVRRLSHLTRLLISARHGYRFSANAKSIWLSSLAHAPGNRPGRAKKSLALAGAHCQAVARLRLKWALGRRAAGPPPIRDQSRF